MFQHLFNLDIFDTHPEVF